MVWTACWLHNVLLGYDYDNNDGFILGIDDDGYINDEYRDDIIDSRMRAVLQEWCGPEFDVEEDDPVANENLNRFRARRCQLVHHFRDSLIV